MSNFSILNALNHDFGGKNGALYEIFSFFKNQILPQIKALSNKADLYFVSLCLFAAAIVIGGASMIARVCFRRARRKSCGRILLLFSLTFFSDLLICFCELNFCGKYFKTVAEAYVFCFLKFIVLLILYFMMVAENSVLKKLDEKSDKTNFPALRRVICETPAPLLSNARQRDFKQSDDEKSVPRYISYIKPRASTPPRPDVNIGYILALCEGLKKEPLTLTERARITDLELAVKTNDFSTPKQTEALNEELRWLIKKAALCEYKPNALF